jgi:hypothetical protein
MTETEKPTKNAGLETLSINSSRRNGVREDRPGNPGRENLEKDSTQRTRVLDQQTPKR